MTPPRFSVAAALAGASLYALAYLQSGLALPGPVAGLPSMVAIEGALHLLLLVPLVAILQRLAARYAVARLEASTQARFHRVEPWTHAAWIAGIAIGWRIGFSTALTLALLAALAGSQAALLRRAAGPASIPPRHSIAGLFLVSGFAALIYQVAWQRLLFTQFGVNSESVTAIVSVFMFGLGVGALAGGWLQARFPARLVHIFVATEVGIGLFGLASVEMIQLVRPAHEPTMPDLVLRVYAVLGVPTLLMGATLPVLIAYFQRHLRDIGRTVGLLYALNTLGSAIAAFATVEVLFVLGGLRSSIALAALLNFATAAMVWRASRRLTADEAEAPRTLEGAPHAPALPYAAALGGLAAIGFISLSLEILWYRLIGFMTASRPEVFGLLLAAFLAGVAGGSLRAKRFAHDDAVARRRLALDLAAAAAAAYLAIPVVSFATAAGGKVLGAAIAYAGAGLVAFWCGGVFPALVHLASRERRGGATSHVAPLYFANIVGSALGPLVTGFLLLDRVDLGPAMVLFAAATLVLGLLLAPRPRPLARVAALGAAAAVAGLAYGPLYGGHLERLQHARFGAVAFRHVVQDRTAIVTVEPAAEDIIYGHGMYDGRFNIDPVVNTNVIVRPYMMAAFHREPRRILEIGLSGGSWAKVLTLYAPLRELVVVEIGRSYPPLVARYPQEATVLTDPRVKIHVDDGRRWLANHPDERFDVIVMNTTLPWRSNITNLLSREFLELARAHLLPGGVVYYNAVDSEHTPFTAAHVFAHVARFGSMVAASDAPFDMTTEERRENLLRFRGPDGTPVFEASEAHRRKLASLLQSPLGDVRDALLARRDLLLVTDDNMATEFKARY